MDGQAALLLSLSLTLVLDRSLLVSDLLEKESPTSRTSEGPLTDQSPLRLGLESSPSGPWQTMAGP